MKVAGEEDEDIGAQDDGPGEEFEETKHKKRSAVSIQRSAKPAPFWLRTES
jgi:hypothetical protein